MGVEYKLSYTASEIDRKLGEVDNLSKKLNNKVDVIAGKGLSTEDYTTEEKEKLYTIETGATKVIVDASLTSRGQAADAKSVGDALASKQPIGDYMLRTDLTNLELITINDIDDICGATTSA